MALAAALEEMPEAPGAQAALFEQLRALQLGAREHGLQRLDFALGGVLAQLERDQFGPDSLAAVRELAKQFELLGSPVETGTRPAVREPSFPARGVESTAELTRSGPEAPRHRLEPRPSRTVPSRAAGADLALRGRRVLVADDDPEVRWFYVAVLKESGMIVYEAADGLGAMDLARVDPPDVILADILMPELDGLGLCEAVRREPRLDGVPVVLLSWRQDFVHRMRELRVEAQGYLRKEASAQQVRQCIEGVLEPQTSLEASLRAEAEVRGNLDSIGVGMLFRAVRAHRPTAQLVLQDPWSLFEAHFWRGTLVYLRRTAIDGTVSTGVAALPSLVGMASGRFVVAAGEDIAGPGPQEEDLDAAFSSATDELSQTIRELASSVDQRVSFDESAVGLYVRHSPESVRSLVERLAVGETPRSLWESGESSRALVDALLITLARQAVITGLERQEPAPLADGGSRDPSEQAAADWDDEEPTRLYSSQPPPGPSEPTERYREDQRVQSAMAMHRGPVNAAPRLTDAVDRPIVTAGEGSGVMADLVGLPRMKSGPGILGWAFVVLLCATAGFLTWRIVMPAPELAARDQAQGAPVEVDRTEAADEPEPSALERLGLSAFSGRLLPGVDEGLGLEEGQGVLRLQGDPRVQVTVDGVDHGPLPVQLVLDEGRHEVRYQIRNDWTHRFYFVKAGYTRDLQVSASPGGFVDAR